MTLIILLLVALLAFANGSNDNGKGVATLVGFGAARPMQALLYASLTTAIGAGVSFWLAGGLLKGFSAGLFTAETPFSTGFYAAVLIGACGWVLLASSTGMPVSTTHAIIGALTGAGLVAFGNTRFQWSFLGAKFAVPLAISPFLSLATVYILAWPVLFVVRRLAQRCLCVMVSSPGVESCDVSQSVAGAAPGTVSLPTLVAGTQSDCPPDDRAAAVTTSGAANAIHWASCGLTSFARGWNDTPKIAALSLFALAGVGHGMALSFAVVAVSMAAGGLFAGRRVLDTLARKLTPLPLAESLTASLTTATLVILASNFALPVSTTHVATGSIIGAGLKNNPAGVKWAKVFEIALSWVITLPVAALIAAAAMGMLQW